MTAASQPSPIPRGPSSSDALETDSADSSSPSGSMPRRVRPRILLVLHLLLAAVSLYPICSVNLPALVDYPNHTARMHVLVHYDERPALQQNYAIMWTLFPNLAMDLIVPSLSRFMEVETASRVFLAISLLMLAMGTACLSRAIHGYWSLLPLAVYLFLYNIVTFYGLVNFLFGSGLCLLGLAAWIATAHRTRSILRIIGFCLFASVLYLMHLFALATYGLGVMVHTIASRGKASDRFAYHWKQCAYSAVQFVIPGLLWQFSFRALGSDYLRYGTAREKLRHWFGFTLFTGESIDLYLFLLVLIFLVSGFALRELRVARGMRPMLAAYLIAAIAMPQWLSGSNGADLRLPFILVFIGLASLQFQPSDRRIAAIFAGIAAALFAVRMNAISHELQAQHRNYQEFRQTLHSIPEGIRLLTVQEPTPSSARLADVIRHRQMTHMPSLAVIERSAFVPLMFTSYCPLRAASANAAIDSPQGAPITPSLLRDPLGPYEMPAGMTRYWSHWKTDFDYLLWIDGDSQRERAEYPELELVEQGSFFDLYRIRK